MIILGAGFFPFATFREKLVNLPNKAVNDLLNKVDPPQRAMAFCVPTRVIRVIATDDSFRTFRVEQLVLTNRNPVDPKGNWTTISTHGSATVGASYNDAMNAAMEAQKKMLHQMKQRQKPSLVTP